MFNSIFLQLIGAIPDKIVKRETPTLARKKSSGEIPLSASAIWQNTLSHTTHNIGSSELKF